MNQREAEAALEDAEITPCMEMPIPEAKRVVNACLAAEIPALLGGRPGCASGGCSPKALILVRPDDVPRVARLLHDEWRDMALREGTVDFEVGVPSAQAEVAEDAEPACPACGCREPLAAGACADCGLVLG